MYSKFFIYRVIICAIPIILIDIALICSIITGGYEGNLKATIIVVILFHILLYILARKQVKLLMQAFKQNGFKEINNLFNMKYVFLIIFFMVFVNVNIRMYNFDDVQCTVIPSVAYGFVTGMNLQLC